MGKKITKLDDLLNLLNSEDIQDVIKYAKCWLMACYSIVTVVRKDSQRFDNCLNSEIINSNFEICDDGAIKVAGVRFEITTDGDINIEFEHLINLKQSGIYGMKN